jgi:hypothetical protein
MFEEIFLFPQFELRVIIFSYSASLMSFERAIEVAERLNVSVEDLACIYDNMAHVYRRLG